MHSKPRTYLVAMLLAAMGWLAPALAGNGPAEGSIWDHKGVDYFGDPFQTSLIIQEGHLVEILPKGDQLDLGPLSLDSYNEYVAPPALYQTMYPLITRMTFRFSADFSSVHEVMIMNYQGKCAAGNCANNVDTADFTLRQ